MNILDPKENNMKTTLPDYLKNASLFLLIVWISVAGHSQTVPELVFRNPVLLSGNAGKDGAKYKFDNIANGIYAIVEIKGRSANDVVLGAIDSSGIGWDKAFQPYLGIANVGANREWWMEFKMEFYKSSNDQKKKIDQFFVTGLDIDGDGGNLNEWAEMKKPAQVSLSPVTSITTTLLGTVIDILDFNNNGSDFRVNGPITNFTNIDTAATAVMATYMYEKKDMIEFKIGGKTNANGGSSGNVGIRMNSFWFKQFIMSPDPVLLPVKLVSFAATLNDDQADLKWTTSSEKDVSHFSIEKSLDGQSFSQAGIVFAAGNSAAMVNYTFADKNINTFKKGIIYYRLRSIDIDGSSELSAVRMITLGSQNKQVISILTYPNPVTNELHITIPTNWQGKKATYEVLDNNGRTARSKVVASANQTESISVANLPRGFYIARVICDDESAQQKVIK